MSGLDHPVLVCLGGGGVGKTTLAACAAIAAAGRGERAVVLTIDPARRLASTLGLEPVGGDRSGGLGSAAALGNEPTLVPGPWPGELWAAMLDPAATMSAVLREHGSDEQADRILTNPLFATIVGSLSGSNEYLAAERLHQLHHDPRFDRVVIDTPPSRHAIDFLQSPDRLSRFLHNRLYQLVLAPRRGLLRPVSSAAQLILRTAAKLVGADLVDNVIRLFADAEGLDEGFRRRADETAALLAGPDCGYVVITSPRHEPIREALWILERLAEQDRAAAAIVVNRLLPYGRQPTPPPASRRSARRRALDANWEELAVLARLEDEAIDKLRGELPPDLTTITVAERVGATSTVADLVELANQLHPGSNGAAGV
ncbi:MAG: ArsA-related P-loop ATPase [Actinomycetota bacterium]